MPNPYGTYTYVHMTIFMIHTPTYNNYIYIIIIIIYIFRLISGICHCLPAHLDLKLRLKPSMVPPFVLVANPDAFLDGAVFRHLLRGVAWPGFGLAVTTCKPWDTGGERLGNIQKIYGNMFLVTHSTIRKSSDIWYIHCLTFILSYFTSREKVEHRNSIEVPFS